MTITLRRDRVARVWTATYDPPDETRALFGTATIPTAYDTSVEADRVMREIRAMNPNARVIVPILDLVADR